MPPAGQAPPYPGRAPRRAAAGGHACQLAGPSVSLHVLTWHAALCQVHCLSLFTIPRAVRQSARARCVGFYALSRNAARMLRRVDFGDMRIGAGEDTTMGMCAAPHACHT